MRASAAEMKRILKDEYTGGGTGCFSATAVIVFVRWVRYQVMALGMKRGPTVKRSVLSLQRSVCGR